MRVADARLLSFRVALIAEINSDGVTRWKSAISLSPVQNESSRAMLVLRPSSTMERLSWLDFIGARLPTESKSSLDNARCCWRVRIFYFDPSFRWAGLIE